MCIRDSPEDELALTNPSAVFEVLSPSTERFDRGEKFAVYREMPSVQLIVFLRADAVNVERYERAEGGWLLTVLGANDVLRVLHATIPVADLYRDVSLTQPSPPTQ